MVLQLYSEYRIEIMCKVPHRMMGAYRVAFEVVFILHIIAIFFISFGVLVRLIKEKIMQKFIPFD